MKKSSVVVCGPVFAVSFFWVLGTGLLSGCLGPKAEPKVAADEPDAEECLARGDAAMAEGNELDAVFWYNEAERCGSTNAHMKIRVANRALVDACAEPSPAVIDNTICRDACAAKIPERFSAVKDRLLRRYVAERRFSIADAAGMTPEDRHSFACELAAVGNDEGLGYMNSRKLIDFKDTRQGGVLHFAAAAGHEALVKWLVGACGAYPWEKDDKDATPSDWIDLELPLSANPRAETLRRVKAYLASKVSESVEQDGTIL